MPPILEKNNRIIPLSQVGYTNEEELQKILERYPQLLQEGSDEELQTVCREVSMEGQFLDILMLDANGMPVAIEVKLARNGDIRRKVTGQIIEYASLLSNLTVDELDQISHGELNKTLQIFAKKNNEEFEEIRKNCGTHLKAGEVRIIVAVDKAPDNLIEIFDFLCKRSNLDIRLVEIKKFILNNEEVLFVPNTLIKPENVESQEIMNPYFMDVINEYTKIAQEGFPVWENNFADWKCVCPDSWRDLNVHYEFCDLNREISVEIHLENPQMKNLRKLLMSIKRDLSKNNTDSEIIWDQDWYEGCRLGFKFSKKTDPTVIAEKMCYIIKETSDKIQDQIDRIPS